MHLLTLAGNARNIRRRRKRAWRHWSAKRSGWQAEIGQARNEQENLGVESGQAQVAV